MKIVWILFPVLLLPGSTVLAQAPLRQLTTAPGIDGEPAWSGDGTQIVFSSGRSGSVGIDLWSKPAAGGPAVHLTSWTSNEFGATWSPDNVTIAFYWAVEAHIYTFPAAGGLPVAFAQGPGAERNPAWSPDGTRIAFDDNHGGNTDLWVQPVSGGPALRVTTHAAVDEHPSWSPDGATLVFNSDREGGELRLWLVPAAGGDASPVGTGPAIQPAWRPGSDRIAYVALPEYDIHMIPAAGGAAERITDSGDALDYAPAWSPDGSELAFSRRLGNEADIWIAAVPTVPVSPTSWSGLKRRFP